TPSLARHPLFPYTTLFRSCLESLQDSPQGVRLETIVVDNGSADGAADIVAREFPEVILVRNAANRGFARANNQAAARARGRYLRSEEHTSELQSPDHLVCR